MQSPWEGPALLKQWEVLTIDTRARSLSFSEYLVCFHWELEILECSRNMKQGNSWEPTPQCPSQNMELPPALKPWECPALRRYLAPRTFAVSPHPLRAYFSKHDLGLRGAGLTLGAKSLDSFPCGVCSLQRLTLMLTPPAPRCFCEHPLLSVSKMAGIQLLQALSHVILTTQPRTNAFLSYETHLRGAASQSV